MGRVWFAEAYLEIQKSGMHHKGWAVESSCGIGVAFLSRNLDNTSLGASNAAAHLGADGQTSYAGALHTWRGLAHEQ